MKLLQAMGLAGAVMATGGAQAAAISDITITLDWSSLSITGPLTQPGGFTDPQNNETFSADADAGVGIQNSELAYDRAVDGATASAGYVAPGVDLAAGYEFIADLPGYISYAHVIITDDGAGVLNGWGWSDRGLFYQTAGTGRSPSRFPMPLMPISLPSQDSTMPMAVTACSWRQRMPTPGKPPLHWVARTPTPMQAPTNKAF